MTSRNRITTSRSRAFDALIGTSFAAVVIGVAVFGDITYHPTHRAALVALQGTKTAMVLHCQGKTKPACAKAPCAGRPPCSR